MRCFDCNDKGYQVEWDWEVIPCECKINSEAKIVVIKTKDKTCAELIREITKCEKNGEKFVMYYNQDRLADYKRKILLEWKISNMGFKRRGA